MYVVRYFFMYVFSASSLSTVYTPPHPLAQLLAGRQVCLTLVRCG